VCTFSNSLNDFYHLKATDSTNSEHPTLPAGVLAVGLLTFYWLIRFRQLKNIFHQLRSEKGKLEHWTMTDKVLLWGFQPPSQT